MAFPDFGIRQHTSSGTGTWALYNFGPLFMGQAEERQRCSEKNVVENCAIVLQFIG
ncbi:hypothetical protein M5D96_014023 [Drosophila gunungcola]|uniref:Uncharacterized protein n=1 Tax=Drosophila gunungcola TaxID=103775 RepID=A0A9P9YA71_9MUSC|nr:hypothetical protein M5D96_014023 [Drosophila gunungcola]